MQDTKEVVKEKLINIFNGKSTTLPEWELLKNVASDAEDSYKNKIFANSVYYAIKDLLKPVGYNHREFIKKDGKNKTLTMKEYFLSINNVSSTVEERTFKPEKWEPFKNVDLETLNKEQKDIPILKKDNYLISGNEIEAVKEHLNTKEISENIDSIFLPVINSNFKHLTFEQAIKGFTKGENKGKNELDFNSCFKSDDGADFTLEIIKKLDAIKKTKLPRQGQYLYGVIKELQLEEIIRKEIPSNKVYEIFCKEFDLRYTRITRSSEIHGSAFKIAMSDTKHLVESLLKKLSD